jgi:cysteinyl-tRNA synthetase
VPPGVGAADPGELGGAARAVVERWTAAVDNDLDLPRGLAVVRDALRDGSMPAAERRWLLLEADRVLGLDLAREVEAGAAEAADDRVTAAPALDALPTGAAELLRERADARATKDWARSDALRTALTALGVEVVDGPGGAQKWQVRGR